MIWLVIGSLVPSFVVAWLAGFALRRGARQLGLVDQPGHRKVHTTPTPLGGGLAIWLGVVGTFACGHAVLLAVTPATEANVRFGPAAHQALEPTRPQVDETPPAGVDAGERVSNQAAQPVARWVPEFAVPHLGGLTLQSTRLWIVLAAGTVLMLLGLADDRIGVDWRVRLAVEVLVAAFMVWQGWRLSLFIEVPWLTSILSVLWIVVLVNSFNFLDNMDSLSGGVAAIAAGMLAAALLTTPDPVTNQPQLFVGGFLLVLVGALLGFLWHNRPPARLFMGDAGAYFIGYLLAIATMTATFAGGAVPRHAIFVPLCVLAVPLYDLLSVIVIRLRGGRSPFVGDTSHFSHRLVELGLSKPQAVLTIYLTTAGTGLGALLLHQVDAFGATIIGLMVIAQLTVIAILEATAHARRRS